MKFTNVFTFILFLHVAGLGVMLLVQSGCSQNSFEVDQADLSAPIIAPENTPGGALDYVEGEEASARSSKPQRTGRFTPRRPVAEESTLPSSYEDDLQPEESVQVSVLSSGSEEAPLPLNSFSSLPRPASPQQEASFPVPQGPLYKVKSGDSLWKIAHAHGLSLTQLLDLNKHQHLTRDSLIRPGQSIVVAATSKGEPSAPQAIPELGSLETYRVKAGDTLSKIAKRCGITVAELKAWNGLSSDVIRVGQELNVKKTEASALSEVSRRVDTSKGEPASFEPGQERIHVVTSGQTASDIAKKYGVKAADLLLANAISDPRKLQVNQKLVIPGASGVSEVGASASTPPSSTAKELSSSGLVAGAAQSTQAQVLAAAAHSGAEEDDAIDDQGDEDDDEDDWADAFDEVESTPLVPVG